MSKETKPIEVSRVIIKIAGKEISLTVDEARELRDILQKTFPTPPVVVTQTIIEREKSPTWPLVPVYPTWCDTPKWGHFDITCQGINEHQTLCIASNS